jgi:hypothetical protein
MKKIRPYKDTSFQGVILIERKIKPGAYEGVLGIQISEDGRIWINIDGVSFIRFRKIDEVEGW